MSSVGWALRLPLYVTSVVFDIANDTGCSGLHLYPMFSDTEYMWCVSVLIEAHLQDEAL